MSKLAKHLEKVRRLLAKGSHYLVLTSPAERPQPRPRRPA